MIVYKVQIKKGYGTDVVEKVVAAPTIAKAVSDAQRYAEKNYYSNTEILSVEKFVEVDVHYKS